MKKNLIISSGIVFIMLILSTLTLFTHTIKTPVCYRIHIFRHCDCIADNSLGSFEI